MSKLLSFCVVAAVLGDHVPFGEASNSTNSTGSCENSCGFKSMGNTSDHCSCDVLCTARGTCCPDVNEWCDVSEASRCEGIAVEQTCRDDFDCKWSSARLCTLRYQQIKCGEIVSGNLSGLSAWTGSQYELKLEQAYAPRLQLSASTCGSSFDTVLTLEEFNGASKELVAACDDCGSCGLQSVVTAKVDDATRGSFFLVSVTSYAGHGHGQFQLSLDCEAADASEASLPISAFCDSYTSSYQIDCGGFVSGQTNSNCAPNGLGTQPSRENYINFSVLGDDIQEITLSTCDPDIFATTSDFDTHLTIVDVATQTVLDSCDDCGPCARQSSLVAKLPPGDYMLIVEGSGEAEGEFSVAMKCSLPGFDDGGVAEGEGSCEDRCGAPKNSSGYCFCDTLCDQMGDCCSDYDEWCALDMDQCEDLSVKSTCQNDVECNWRPVMKVCKPKYDRISCASKNISLEIDALQSWSGVQYELKLGQDFDLLELSISTCGSDFDTVLALDRMNSTGQTEQIENCDDCGSCGRQSVIVSKVDDVTSKSIFIVTVTNFAESGKGHLQLSVECNETEAEPTLAPISDFCREYEFSRQIDCGGVVYGHTNSICAPNAYGQPAKENYVYFTVSDYAKKVTLNTCDDETNFDTHLTIYSADFQTEYGSCDDCGTCASSFQASLDAKLPPGEYVLVVEGFGYAEGNYGLAMTCSDTDIGDENGLLAYCVGLSKQTCSNGTPECRWNADINFCRPKYTQIKCGDTVSSDHARNDTWGGVQYELKLDRDYDPLLHISISTCNSTNIDTILLLERINATGAKELTGRCDNCGACGDGEGEGGHQAGMAVTVDNAVDNSLFLITVTANRLMNAPTEKTGTGGSDHFELTLNCNTAAEHVTLPPTITQTTSAPAEPKAPLLKYVCHDLTVFACQIPHYCLWSEVTGIKGSCERSPDDPCAVHKKRACDKAAEACAWSSNVDLPGEDFLHCVSVMTLIEGTLVFNYLNPNLAFEDVMPLAIARYVNNLLKNHHIEGTEGGSSLAGDEAVKPSQVHVYEAFADLEYNNHRVTIRYHIEHLQVPVALAVLANLEGSELRAQDMILEMLKAATETETRIHSKYGSGKIALVFSSAYVPGGEGSSSSNKGLSVSGSDKTAIVLVVVGVVLLALTLCIIWWRSRSSKSMIDQGIDTDFGVEIKQLEAERTGKLSRSDVKSVTASDMVEVDVTDDDDDFTI